MKIKDGFVLRNMAGEFIAVPFDESYSDVGALISLNETGAFLWKALEEEKEMEDLCKALVCEYGITEEEAMTAAESFTEGLKAAGLLS